MTSVSGTKNAVIFLGLKFWSLLFFWVDGKYPQMSIPVQIYAECPPWAVWFAFSIVGQGIMRTFSPGNNLFLRICLLLESINMTMSHLVCLSFRFVCLGMSESKFGICVLVSLDFGRSSLDFD